MYILFLSLGRADASFPQKQPQHCPGFPINVYASSCLPIAVVCRSVQGSPVAVLVAEREDCLIWGLRYDLSRVGNSWSGRREMGLNCPGSEGTGFGGEGVTALYRFRFSLFVSISEDILTNKRYITTMTNDWNTAYYPYQRLAYKNAHTYTGRWCLFLVQRTVHVVSSYSTWMEMVWSTNIYWICGYIPEFGALKSTLLFHLIWEKVWSVWIHVCSMYMNVLTGIP